MALIGGSKSCSRFFWVLCVLLVWGFGSVRDCGRLAAQQADSGAQAPDIPAKISQAIEELRSEDQAVRRQAATRLKKLGPLALPPLQATREQLAAAEKDAPAKEAGKAFRKRLEKIIAEIKSQLAPRIDQLVKQLGHDKSRFRKQAQKELARIGPPALAALRAAAKSEDPEVRWRAATLVIELGIGNWKKAMLDFCRNQGLDAGSVKIIEHKLVSRFFPHHRFFSMDAGGAEKHYRVSKAGEVSYIEYSGGGDISLMLGKGRPLIKSKQDALAFFRLVLSLRYGFGNLDRNTLRLEKRGDNSWGVRAASRYFTITLDDKKRLEHLHMR